MYRHGLYVCIILETAHHRTTFRIFCNFTQKTIPEENSCKMFHISIPIVLFLMGRSKTFLGIRIKFHLGKIKEGVRGSMGRSPKWGVFFAKFQLLSKIQTLSQKLFIRQTSNHHHCNQHAQNLHAGTFRWFWAVLPGHKQLCLCILRNKYGFQIQKLWKK